MLKELDTIYLYKGASSNIEFDFTDFNFEEDSYCEFSMVDPCTNKELKKVTFTESAKYIVTFRDEFTTSLDKKIYKYNIMYFIGEERFPQCADSDIIVEEVINSYE